MGDLVHRLIAVAALVLCVGVAEPARAYIYWSSGIAPGGNWAIARANLDGTGIDDAFVVLRPRPLPGRTDSVLRAVASDGRHVYWLDDAGVIGRANPDGTHVDPAFIEFPDSEPTAVVQHLAVGGGYLFFSRDRFTGPPGSGNALQSIWRVELDGSGIPQPIHSTAGWMPIEGIAADDRFVYWSTTDEPTRSTTIRRATHDGSGERVVIADAPDTISGFAAGGGQLFWGPFGHTGIVRADIDGTRLERDFIRTPGEDPTSVAVGNGHLYWIVWRGGRNWIDRADLDGTNVVHGLARGVRSLSGGSDLAVDAVTGPLLSGLRIAPPAFAATWWHPGAVSPGRRARVGARVRFRLTAPATVRLTVDRGDGASIHPGAVKVRGKRGLNEVWFSGRLAGRALGLGSYRMTARVLTSDPPGSAGRASFDVVPLAPLAR